MKLMSVIVFIFTLLASSESIAVCIRVDSTGYLSQQAIAAGYTASYWTGAHDTANSKNLGLPAVISLSNGTFQPSGTLLASTALSFLSQGDQVPYSAKQVLFRCDVADKSNIFEMYATNGDNAYTGMFAASEIEGAYYSFVKNVAVRLTNTKTGEYYSRYWKSRQFDDSDLYSDGTYIYIPAGAFSDVLMELYRIDSTSYYADASNVYSYAYSQPHGYIAFKGPGMSNNVTPGADSATNYDGFYGYWPASWSLYNTGTKFVRGATCKVNDYTNLVFLPMITVSELNSGGASQADFSVSIECESGAISGTASSTTTSANVSMGFVVNQSTAVNAATSLGLTTASGGLTWLLDNNYGTKSNIASGVGIRIYDRTGRAINLLPNLSSFGTGNTRGWYAFKELTTLVSSGTTDIYNGNFTASLEAISGQTVTVGTVNAQLQVVVGFQ